MEAQGFSRSEQKDVNDVLTFKVKPNYSYIVAVVHHEKIIKKEIRTNQNPEQMIEIKIRNE